MSKPLANGLRSRSRSSRSLASGREGQVAGARSSRELHVPGVLTSPSWDPVRPNRAHRAIQRVLVSIRRLHVSSHGIEPPLVAREEARQVRGLRVSTHSSPRMHAERDAAVTLKKPRPKPRKWVAVTITLERRCSACRETRRGSSFVVVRTPGGAERVQRARSPLSTREFLCEEESPPIHTRGGQSRRARKPA